MHTIITKFTLVKPLDQELLRKVERELFMRAKELYPGFLGAQLVQLSETETVSLSFFESREALDEVSSKLAGPWFAENVRPLLAGPVQRMVGEVVARFGP
ncbi:MAG TPA: hypothetical protein VMI54_08255 [Polyangiaceae bacterium]|nr:hypothetical protein [Polyangiaceae bacterium]